MAAVPGLPGATCQNPAELGSDYSLGIIIAENRRSTRRRRSRADVERLVRGKNGAYRGTESLKRVRASPREPAGVIKADEG